MGSRGLGCLGWAGCCLLLAASWARAEVRWIQVSEFNHFERESSGSSAWVSPEWQSPIPFRELVLSWNLQADSAKASSLQVEAQVKTAGRWGRWWHLGRWGGPMAGAGTEEAPKRTSIRGQRDETGAVETDTLVLRSDAAAVRVRVRFDDPAAGPVLLKRMDLSLWSPKTVADSEPRFTADPSRVLEVPMKSQADYPEGVTQWCSPTSLAMLMAHWGRQSGKPEWDLDVRTVAAGVHDPGWPGTGNWSFNAAYAGSRPGLQAAAVRLAGLDDLAALLEAGIPVATSVSYAVLKGAAKPEKGDGHLVVICGLSPFTVTVNDPGVRLSRVRREFPLPAFRAAWSASHQTAYVVWPEGRTLPVSPSGTW